MNLEHVIQPGETWEDIAALYGIGVEMLLIFNQIRTYDPIYTEVEYGNGRYQTLHIPDPTIEWCIDDTTFTPELVPCDRPDTLEEQMLVAEQAGLLPIEIELGTGVTGGWPEWQTIRQMPIAASIVGYDAAGFYLVQDVQGQTATYSAWQIQNLGEFDPERLTRDFLYQWLRDDEENADYETLDERAEFWLLQQLAVWIGGLSYFEPREVPPSPDEIRGRLEALLGESYTYEAVVQLALAVIETLQQSPYAQTASFAALDELARQAALYEMAAQLDAVRLALQQWSPQEEQALLSQLDAHLATIPEVVLDVSTVELVGGFKNFHDVMCQRYEMLLNLQYRVLEAEEYFAQLRVQTDVSIHVVYIDLNTLFSLVSVLTEVMLSIFIEPIDWVLTAHDVLGGEVLALVGLLPFIPGSIARLRRLAGSIPEFMREARRIFGGIWDDLNTQADDLMRWLLGETELLPAFAGGINPNRALSLNFMTGTPRGNNVLPPDFAEALRRMFGVDLDEVSIRKLWRIIGSNNNPVREVELLFDNPRLREIMLAYIGRGRGINEAYNLAWQLYSANYPADELALILTVMKNPNIPLDRLHHYRTDFSGEATRSGILNELRDVGRRMADNHAVRWRVPGVGDVVDDTDRLVIQLKYVTSPDSDRIQINIQDALEQISGRHLESVLPGYRGQIEIRLAAPEHAHLSEQEIRAFIRGAAEDARLTPEELQVIEIRVIVVAKSEQPYIFLGGSF